MRKLVSLIAGLTLLFFVFAKKKEHSMLDPLLNTELTQEEVRTYRYLLALQEIYLGAPVDGSLNVAAICRYLDANQGAIFCTCGRWYPLSGGIKECLSLDDEMLDQNTDHHKLQTADHEDLQEQIRRWEAFRALYSQAVYAQSEVKVALKRVLAINLYYFSCNLAEG
jgi:hypothetical protein